MATTIYNTLRSLTVSANITSIALAFTSYTSDYYNCSSPTTIEMKITSIASLMGFFYICFLVFLVTVTGFTDAARVFKVGDELGWQEPEDNNTDLYSNWAGRNRFRVGDSLLFEYKSDSVIEVEKWGYYHCNSSNPIIAFNNGRSTVNLDRSGPFYFISGVSDHCKNGQRLIIEVMGFHHQTPYSPPYMAAPPDSYSGLAPSPLQSSGATVKKGFSSAFLVAMLVGLVWSV